MCLQFVTGVYNDSSFWCVGVREKRCACVGMCELMIGMLAVRDWCVHKLEFLACVSS